MRYTTKDFLTPDPHESGSVICTIETALTKNIREWTISKGGEIGAQLRISDCSGNIYLEFGACGQNEYDKRLKKLDTLIEKIQAMRNQYEEMWNSHVRDVNYVKQKNEREAADKERARRGY